MSTSLEWLSAAKAPLTKLLKWVIRQIDMRKSKERFFRAIKDETELYSKNMDELQILTDEKILPLLDIIEERPTAIQLNELFNLSSQGIRNFAEIIDSYIKLSVAIKELSVNEYYMKELEEYDRFLCDFVHRIRDTVVDVNKVFIGGEYFRFIKLYEDKIFKKVKKKDMETETIKLQKYIQIIKYKIKPLIVLKRPRKVFRHKRLKIIFEDNFEYFNKVIERFKIEIPSSDLREYIPTKFLPMTVIFEEVSMIEFKPEKRRGFR